MNGTALFNTDGSVIDRRPIITCAGELEVFSSIEENLLQALPQDSCEWKRALGRPIRAVHVGATFAPFSTAVLPKGNQWDLIRYPVFHIYWTECADIDAYKNNVKEEIEVWLKELTSKDIQDWLIVVVENYDGKRANKLLPRTTVLDKIRADFAPKQGDRCISVINPGRVESRSADSWRGLVGRIRHLLLVAYAKAVARLEDHVRQQRDRRNDPGWDFMKYFLLQEELAQVLEMLGLYDEALVQYDELDALFSQFIVNGITSDSVTWLLSFQKPLERWHALKLGPSVLPEDPSLLELRAYLFAKQAHMLLLTNKVWEMASRCVPFLHTCTRELNILEITSPPGTVSCWLFLASMEVLQTCDKFNDADAVEDYSLHTACLWEYASQKLRELGDLCGLMPGGTPTSDQLHTVVGLSSGMGDNPGTPVAPSPTDKLKEALCSQDAFNKMYLELAELAMGTYKHIGRLRSARLVGIELASFYMLLGETQKSAAFLTDAVRTFQKDGWNELAALTQVDLASCHRKAKDVRKFITTCASISAVQEIDTLIRWTYFDEMRSSLESLDEELTVPFDDIIKLVSVNVKSDAVIMQDSNAIVDVVLDSNFPREVVCTNVFVAMEDESKVKSTEKHSGGQMLTNSNLKVKDPLSRILKIYSHADYKQDKQLERASVVCQHSTENKRKELSMTPPQSDFSLCLESINRPLVITPGINLLRLTKKASTIGKYYLGQAAVQIGKLRLVSSHLKPRLRIEVKEEGPSVKLYKGAAPLLSGIEQVMNLIVTIGSYPVDPDSKIKLTSSVGLSFQVESDEPFTNMLELDVGKRECFSSVRTKLRVFADMLSKSHQVSIMCPWSSKPLLVNLSFTPPLNTTWKLATVNHRKFVQVTITGQCELSLYTEQPKLSVSDVCKVVDVNCGSSQIITQGLSCSFIWELQVTPSAESVPIKAEFSLAYRLSEDSEENRVYNYFFDINDYQTLYVFEAHVEPTKGSEFCRVGALCHLHLTIKCVGHTLENGKLPQSVMYEVLAEQSLWAVCGRSAGVVSFDEITDKQTVVLDIMPISSGHLPLPLIRISKYITASTDKAGRAESQSRLEPFSVGQVYNSSKGNQVHVIFGVNDGHVTT